jgi:hypothetical protein
MKFFAPTFRVVSPFLLALASVQGLEASRTETNISSSFGARVPYMVVKEEEGGNSKREIGLYTAAGKNNGKKLILPGKVMTGEGMEGIIDELGITQHTNRYESLAVVNGKLYLVNLYSDPDIDGSIIEFNSNEHPIVDVASKKPVLRMSLIRSIDDIAVHSFYTDTSDSSNGQVVLVSVKQKNAFGDGFTFAFFLERTRKDKDPVMKLSHAPVIVDYHFYSNALLQRLEVSSTSIFAPTTVNSTARDRAGDAEEFSEWKQNVRNEQEYFNEGLQSEEGYEIETEIVPTYNVRDDQLELSTFPQAEVISDYVYQIYDPLSGAHFLNIGEFTDMKNRKPLVFGSIDTYRYEDTDLGRSSIMRKVYTAHQVLMQEQNEQALTCVVTSIQNALHLICVNTNQGNKVQYLKLTNEDRRYSKMQTMSAAFVVRQDEQTKKSMIFLLTSEKEDKLTQLRTILYGPEGMSMQAVANINTEYYEETDLFNRVKFNDEKEVLFDHMTPVSRNDADYQSQYSVKGAHLNLTQATNGNISTLGYVQATQEVGFNDYLIYKEFNPTKLDRNKSGIYVYNRDKRKQEFHAGKLLTKDAVSLETVLDENGKKTPVQVKSISLNHQFQEHDDPNYDPRMHLEPKQFKLLMSFTHNGESSSDLYFNPVMKDIPVHALFSNLSYIQFVPGIYDHSDEVNVVLSLTSNSRSVLYVVRYRLSLSKGSNGRKELQVQEIYNNYKAPIVLQTNDGAEIKSRMVYDSNGQLYWVETPDLARDDVGFRIKSLETNTKTLNINSSALKNHKFLFLDVAEESKLIGKGGEWRGRRSSTWTLYSGSSLVSTFGEEFKPDQIKEKIKEHTRQSNSFPGLKDILNHLSNPEMGEEFRVVLVEKHDKEILEKVILKELLNTKNENWKFNPQLKMFYATAKYMDQSEVMGNLRSLAEVDTQQNSRNFLIADAADLYQQNNARPLVGNGESAVLDNPTAIGEKDAVIYPHFFYLMATGGELVPLEDFKNRKSRKFPFSGLMFATPAEWEAMQRSLLPIEQDLNLLSEVVVDEQYLTGSWKLWAPETGREAPEVAEANARIASQMEREVMPSLIKLLEELANPELPAKHRVLIVPEELKDTVNEVIINQWATKSNKERRTGWSYANRELDVYRFSAGPQKNPSQSEIMQNFSALRKSKKYKKKPVLIGDVSDIKFASRPMSKEGATFQISDVTSMGTGNDESNPFVDSNDSGAVVPHALYLLSTEGNSVNMPDYEAALDKRDVSSLFVGTMDQWQSLEADLNLEKRIPLVESFEIVQLEAPSRADQIATAEKILNRADIRAINYTFEYSADGQKLDPSEARKQLVAYLVNGSMIYARQAKKDPTLAIAQTLNEFAASLTNDVDLRKSRVVNISFVRQLFGRIFNLPINLDDLPKDDPRVRLANYRQVALDLADPKYDQHDSYQGPLELRYDLIKSVAAHLSGVGSTARNVPSSTIIIGETSTGKTLFWEKLIEVLGLKQYDLRNPSEPNAQAFILRCKHLIDDEPDSSSSKEKEVKQGKDQKEDPRKKKNVAATMTASKAIEHLNNFLFQPNGYKGLILFDDLHNAPEAVRKKLIAWLSTVLDPKGGKIVVKALDSEETREIPVRNIMLGMTLNPPSDPEKIKRYAPNKTDLEMVIASLAYDKDNLEKSFFQRWSRIIKLEKFPSEAKMPSLMGSLREQAKTRFNNHGQLVLVDPDSVQELIEKHRDANAREFLPNATKAFFDVNETVYDKGVFRVLVPLDEMTRKTGGRGGLAGIDPSWEASGRDGQAIQGHVLNNTIPLTVTENQLGGRLSFISFITNTFRALVYENFVNGLIQEEVAQRTYPQNRKIFFGPAFSALSDHMLELPRLHLKSLQLDPVDFDPIRGRKREYTDNFIRLIEEDRAKVAYFTPVIPLRDGASSINTGFLDNNASDNLPTRRQVLSQTVQTLKGIINDYFKVFLRIDDIQDLNDETSWVLSLPESEPETAKLQLGRRIMETYRDFAAKMLAENILENRDRANFPNPSIYDQMRLFQHALDKAIAEMPWTKASAGLIRVISRTAKDLDLGQTPGFQHYLFSSQNSPFLPLSTYRVFQSISSSESLEEIDSTQREDMEDTYIGRCDKFLSSEKL